MRRRTEDQRRWEDDLVRRQRNIAFPDTVENEGRFWRGILTGDRRLTRLQKVGTAIVCVMVLVVWGGILATMVTEQYGDHPLWVKIGNVALPLAIAIGVILLFMGFIGRQMRHSK